MHESTSSTTVTPGDRGELAPVPSARRVLRLVLFGLALVVTMAGAAALPIWLLP